MCVCKLAPFQFVWHSFSVSWTQASIIDREVKTIFHLQVLSCVLDPLLQMCTVSASNLGTADMATFMVNSLYMMKTTLALFEFTDRRLEMLQFQVRFALKWLLTAMESLFCMWPQLTGFDLIPLNPLLSDGRPHTCTHTPACTHVQYSLLFGEVSTRWVRHGGQTVAWGGGRSFSDGSEWLAVGAVPGSEPWVTRPFPAVRPGRGVAERDVSLLCINQC